jgi:hypothetical protein
VRLPAGDGNDLGETDWRFEPSRGGRESEIVRGLAVEPQQVVLGETESADGWF